MDKNTITGLILMCLVITGFMWLNKPSEEQLAEQRRAQAEKVEQAKKNQAVTKITLNKKKLELHIPEAEDAEDIDEEESDDDSDADVDDADDADDADDEDDADDDADDVKNPKDGSADDDPDNRQDELQDVAVFHRLQDTPNRP